MTPVPHRRADESAERAAGPADGTAPPRVLFLGGLGRSGTTLVERLLGELPGAMALGEVIHLWERGVHEGERCGCGVPFGECPVWRRVGEAAFGGWDAVDLDRFAELRAAVDRTRHIPMLARDRLPADRAPQVVEYVEHYLRLYRAVAAEAGATVLIDSSKQASLAFCLRWAARVGRLDLRVLHVVRDSRGVAYSWTRQVRRPEADAGGDEHMTQWSPPRTAVHWNAENGAYQLLARRGVRVRRMRYEDFVADPRARLRDIARFAGLPADGAALAFVGDGRAELTVNHTASGNPMRFRTGRIDVRSDDRWRTALPAADQRRVTAMTLPLLRHYSYLGGDV
ncbi:MULTISPECIES: sulfotransferase [unclassified Spirillospora]|uniref:sulfotransferase n=1 Tax=unclassified Spirillospora TaxID=2642701 RepID=UPI0037216DE7